MSSKQIQVLQAVFGAVAVYVLLWTHRSELIPMVKTLSFVIFGTIFGIAVLGISSALILPLLAKIVKPLRERLSKRLRRKQLILLGPQFIDTLTGIQSCLNHHNTYSLHPVLLSIASQTTPRVNIELAINTFNLMSEWLWYITDQLTKANQRKDVDGISDKFDEGITAVLNLSSVVKKLSLLQQELPHGVSIEGLAKLRVEYNKRMVELEDQLHSTLSPSDFRSVMKFEKVA